MKNIKGTHKQSKSLTVMLVPDSVARVRKIHIPYWALCILGIPILCILVTAILYQSHSGYLENQLTDANTRLSESLLTIQEIKDENENIQREQASAILRESESEQEKKAYQQNIIELLAKVEEIDSIKYSIIKVFKDLDAMEIPFKFNETTLSGGAFRAVGGSYSGDVGDIVTELDITLDNKMRDMRALDSLADDAHALFMARPAGWPVTTDKIVSEFGYRVNPITNQDMEWHNGIDIDVPYGTEVYATAFGVVAFAGWDSGGYGYLVIIEHDYDYSTYYAHNSELLVTVGEKVTRGQLIALSGDSGRSTSAHCHYEVRFDTLPQDPREYF